MPDWPAIYERLKGQVESFGVIVRAESLGLETTGVFDGLSITTNTRYDLETRCYNLAHSFGHVAQWSLDPARQQALYDQLHEAKANKGAAAGELKRALARFREYEEEASEYAAWLLAGAGPADVLPAFTDFARADIEAIVGFHRDGHAPVWETFFAAWRARADRGEVGRRAFTPRPVPAFRPVSIEPQEVIRAVPDGAASPVTSPASGTHSVSPTALEPPSTDPYKKSTRSRPLE